MGVVAEGPGESVHCRTGSLEIGNPINQQDAAVHCRTGSLEN